MEFKRFVNAIILMPCQIVRGGRRLIYRLLSWNEWQGVFLRVVYRAAVLTRRRDRSRDPDVPVREGIVSRRGRSGGDDEANQVVK